MTVGGVEQLDGVRCPEATLLLGRGRHVTQTAQCRRNRNRDVLVKVARRHHAARLAASLASIRG